jgi:hypothetical protein
MDILNLPEHIRILEELLLHQDFSNSPDALEAMFCDSFREVGPDGKLVSREAVIDWLLGKSPTHRWEFTEFEVTEMGPDRAMATYYARQVLPENASAGGARHCSIWRESGPGKTWELEFHQSTRVS